MHLKKATALHPGTCWSSLEHFLKKAAFDLLPNHLPNTGTREVVQLPGHTYTLLHGTVTVSYFTMFYVSDRSKGQFVFYVFNLICTRHRRILYGVCWEKGNNQPKVDARRPEWSLFRVWSTQVAQLSCWRHHSHLNLGWVMWIFALLKAGRRRQSPNPSLWQGVEP